MTIPNSGKLHPTMTILTLTKLQIYTLQVTSDIDARNRVRVGDLNLNESIIITITRSI